MKRPSSTINSKSTNNDQTSNQRLHPEISWRSSPARQSNDETSNKYPRQQTSLAQRVQDRSSQRSWQNSLILGSFSDPPTYIVHFIDPHLTILQSFQVCSLFGQVRIHGHNLRPLQFYSVYNYRTNSSLPMELVTSRTSALSMDIRSVISDAKLADDALAHVQQKGGDIILLRRDPINDSLLIKTLREHRFYSNCFLERHGFVADEKWRQLEQHFHIRLTKSNAQTSIFPHQQFSSTADHIIDQWQNEARADTPFVVLISGEKDMGKSTYTRYLINRAVSHVDSTFSLTYFDCDIGQCEFTMSGCLSYVNIQSPLFGPPCSHIKSNPKPDRLLYYGLVSPQASPVRYLQHIDALRQLWHTDYKDKSKKHAMIVINTMGWGTGLGLELLKETIWMFCPNVVVQLANDITSSSVQNRMPDITPEWLLKEPVFAPYRDKLKMSNQQKQAYDGQLTYEYIKIQSAAVASSTTTQANRSSLRPRDHRLFATWSYFFSPLNLSRVCLPWSQVVHVSLADNTNKRQMVIPDGLKHSIVALCSSEKISELQNAAISINQTFQLVDYEDELFECFGFGWIEHCNKETKSYEIYTPIDCPSDIKLLVYGTFDTPEEFKHMFSRSIAK